MSMKLAGFLEIISTYKIYVSDFYPGELAPD